MFYEPKNGHGLTRDPIKACVVPRPIGWISTVSRDDVSNLAPFSYSNLVVTTPPIFMFACNGAHLEGDVKDSALNARETGEFVYNLVTFQLDGRIVLESTEGEGSEFLIYLPRTVKENYEQIHLTQGHGLSL